MSYLRPPLAALFNACLKYVKLGKNAQGTER
ncbi:hypothetical protein HDF16_004232 [Granulicella aggregans]|uniref:Uncharacterized protein n=1 Tax=Granulicella aggregans TaxID=474949 RepID=A0A7W8E5C6_9BACT|nr:hypothetical protein [Granulicella aggregans]